MNLDMRMSRSLTHPILLLLILKLEPFVLHLFVLHNTNTILDMRMSRPLTRPSHYMRMSRPLHSLFFFRPPTVFFSLSPLPRLSHHCIPKKRCPVIVKWYTAPFLRREKQITSSICMPVSNCICLYLESTCIQTKSVSQPSLADFMNFPSSLHRVLAHTPKAGACIVHFNYIGWMDSIILHAWSRVG